MKVRDISGQKFNRLLAVGHFAGEKWTFKCDCGKEHIARGSSVRRGEIKSCGCLNDGAGNRTHGMSYSSEYYAWWNMLNRCRNPKTNNYKYYGGRGIEVCKRWNVFANFIADMGKKPSNQHSLDRIDGDGNYEPSNCRWVTKKTQAFNRRNTVVAHVNGRDVSLKEACRIVGLNYGTVVSRINRNGWSVERALSA